MTDSVATADSPLPGVFARFAGIITSPRATYEKIVKQPKVIAILALSALVIGLATSAFQMTPRGQQAYLDKQMEDSEKFNKAFGIQPSQEQLDQAYARMQKMAPYMPVLTIVSVFIGTPIMLLIFSVIYWAVFNAALGGTASFKEVMSVVSHATVISALSAVFAGVLAFAQGTVTRFPANLGLLFPMLGEGSFLAAFLGFIDLFAIWGLIVTAIGLGVLYKRNSRNIAIALFVVYGLIATAFASFLSR